MTCGHQHPYGTRLPCIRVPAHTGKHRYGVIVNQPITEAQDKHWGVLSDDGETYRVGKWKDGEWIPGSREDAERERLVLVEQGEPGATVVPMEPPTDWNTFPLGINAVTDLPNWHTHPECLGLTHGHGKPLHKPEPHTHPRTTGWGEAKPLEAGVEHLAWHNGQIEHLARLLDAKTVVLDHNATGHSGTHDTALLINALNDADALLAALRLVVGENLPLIETHERVQLARRLVRARMHDSHYMPDDDGSPV